MTENARFDQEALDHIYEDVSRLRTFIHALPHNGALSDIDTLLSVVQAEAVRQYGQVRRPDRTS